MTVKNNKKEGKSLKKSFYAYYAEHIQPLADSYEKSRISAIESFKYNAFIAIALSFGATLVSYRLFTAGLRVDWVLTILVFVIAVTAYVAYSPILAYRKSVRNDVYPLIFKYFGDKYRYIKKPTINLLDFIGSRLFDYIDSAEIEDQFTGEKDGVTFDIVYAAIFEPRQSGRLFDLLSGYKEPTIIYYGTCIIISTNKKFKSVTLFKCDRGAIGNFLFNQAKVGFSRIHLEDTHFEKKIQVTTTDQEDARLLLTTSLMERLVELEDINRCGMFGSFFDGKLMLMLPGVKWISEPQIRSCVSFTEESNMIIAQMNEIEKMIDILNLKQATNQVIDR